jgi:hypothetical protein
MNGKEMSGKRLSALRKTPYPQNLWITLCTSAEAGLRTPGLSAPKAGLGKF